MLLQVHLNEEKLILIKKMILKNIKQKILMIIFQKVLIKLIIFNIYFVLINILYIFLSYYVKINNREISSTKFGNNKKIEYNLYVNCKY